MVETTGMLWLSANFLSSSLASLNITPPPAQIIGLFAFSSSLATLAICTACPLTVGLYVLKFTVSGYLNFEIVAFWISIGISINTGPFLPVFAM